MAPSSKEQISAALVPAIELNGTPRNFDVNVRLYYAMLVDIPADLLELGVFRAMQRTEFFPKPAEIRREIAEDLAERQLVRLRLGAALLHSRRAEIVRQRIEARRAA
jgi:hypothetical protein